MKEWEEERKETQDKRSMVVTSSFLEYRVYKESSSGSLCKGWAYSLSSYDSMRFTMSWNTGSLMFMSVTGFSSGIPFGNRFFTSCNRHSTSSDRAHWCAHAHTYTHYVPEQWNCKRLRVSKTQSKKWNLEHFIFTVLMSEFIR
jgi:hypothetical protein